MDIMRELGWVEARSHGTWTKDDLTLTIYPKYGGTIFTVSRVIDGSWHQVSKKHDDTISVEELIKELTDVMI